MIEPHAIYSEARFRDAGGAIQKNIAALFRSAPLNWRICLFDSDGGIDNLAGITGVRLILTKMKSGGPSGSAYVNRIYPASGFNTSVTLEQWTARTAWSLEVSLSDDDMSLPVSGKSTMYWAALSVITEDSEIPIAVIQISLRSLLGPTLDRDTLEPFWVEWEDWTGPNEPMGRKGSETYDPQNGIFYKKYSVNPHAWKPITGGPTTGPETITADNPNITADDNIITADYP